MKEAKQEAIEDIQDITPYDQWGVERRQGDRRKADRRTGRDDHLGMRIYRLIRTRLLHLEEVERHQPDRRKSDRRSQKPGPFPRRESRKPLLTQEEIRFLMKGGAA
ncbi:hypothetical protein [Aestuariispira insulae]|uniref:Uncharacterized protein n=1 Tax=Aestuariispira insulae TaxID=1461337 RepID=A0A3D9HRU9_9PROT|nr:hypothetical protein [Aestuariispira insulae]RED52051.1 hypothetical protein DFP90_10268 [Aestuariispira insulae]